MKVSFSMHLDKKIFSKLLTDEKPEKHEIQNG